MSDYMTIDHPDVFKDILKKEHPDTRFPNRKMPDEQTHCPKCDQHGHFNLLLDEYGLGKHFQALCTQCMGWGWVAANSIDATCIHEWTTKWLKIHDRRDTCTKCGTTRKIDTSG